MTMAIVHQFASLRFDRHGKIELCIAHKEGYEEKVRRYIEPSEAKKIAEVIDEVAGTSYVGYMVRSAVSAREQEKQRLRDIIKRTQEKLEELE